MTPAEESLMPEKPLLGEASVSRAHEQQLRAIVDAHFDFIWRLLRRRGLSPQDADDAAQQVFMTATEKIELIAAGSERTYLYGVALRVTANWRRKSQRRSEDQLGVPAETPDDAALPRARQAHPGAHGHRTGSLVHLVRHCCPRTRISARLGRARQRRRLHRGQRLPIR